MNIKEDSEEMHATIYSVFQLNFIRKPRSRRVCAHPLGRVGGGVYEAFFACAKAEFGLAFVGDCLAKNSGFIRAMAGVHSAVSS